MAISKYSSVASHITGSPTLSFTHDVGNGNSILLCIAHYTNISSCQYNGVDMTLLAYYAGGIGYHVSWYYLKNPASGSNNYTVTFASSTYAWACSTAISGHNVDSPLGNTANAYSSGSNDINTTVSSVSDGSWLFGGINKEGSGSNGSAYSTEVIDADKNNDPAGAAFHLVVATGGNITTGLNGVGTGSDLLVVEIKVAASTGSSNFFQLF